MKYKLLITILLFYGSCKGQNEIIAPLQKDDLVQTVQFNKITKLYGILNDKLEVSVPFEYEELPNTVSDFMIAKKNGKYGVIDSKNNIIHQFDYSHIFYNPPYFIGSIKKENITSCCLIDINKGELISLKMGYNSIEIKVKYHENKFYFTARKFENNTIDFYDENGNLINHFLYSDVTEWGDYLIVTLNGKKGIAHLDGEILINPEYIHVDWIDNNEACVYSDLNKPIAKVIDLTTKKVISSEYNTIRRREENGLMVVSKSYDGKKLYGIISPEYKEILPLCDCYIEYKYEAKHFEVTNKNNKEIKKLTFGDLMKN